LAVVGPILVRVDKLLRGGSHRRLSVEVADQQEVTADPVGAANPD
jgi:hypothetical protein